MRKLTAISVAMALLACLVSLAVAAPESVVLELKGELGQEMKHETALEFRMDMVIRDMGSGEQIFELHPRARGNVVDITRVLEVADNGDLTLESQVESFNVSLHVADLSLDIALEGPEGGPPQLIKLPPLPIQAVTSKNGSLVALNGLDKLPIPPIPGPEGKKIDLKEMISGMLEEFNQPQFPEGPVAIGDSWGFEIIIDPGAMAEKMGGEIPPEAKAMMSSMKFPIKCTSTLTGFEVVGEVECARIVVESPWELEFPMGPGMMLREHGDTVVTTWFDYQAGHVAREVFEVRVEMRAGTPDLALAEMEMTIDGESELR
jgi:hypothetical protein